MKYGCTKQVDGSFEVVVPRVKAALAEQGFGVLTEIDVKATLKEKLGVEFDKYLIWGACNPPLAYQALQKEREIGLLMPCNVIIYETGGKIFVSAILPTTAISMIGNQSLLDIAEQAEEKLCKAIDNL